MLMAASHSLMRSPDGLLQGYDEDSEWPEDGLEQAILSVLPKSYGFTFSERLHAGGHEWIQELSMDELCTHEWPVCFPSVEIVHIVQNGTKADCESLVKGRMTRDRFPALRHLVVEGQGLLSQSGSVSLDLTQFVSLDKVEAGSFIISHYDEFVGLVGNLGQKGLARHITDLSIIWEIQPAAAFHKIDLSPLSVLPSLHQLCFHFRIDDSAPLIVHNFAHLSQSLRVIEISHDQPFIELAKRINHLPVTLYFEEGWVASFHEGPFSTLVVKRL